MIKKILVPLDGSNLAECAVTYAEELATRLGICEVVLVGVTSRVKGFSLEEELSLPEEVKLMPVATCSIEEKTSQYLGGVAKRLEEKGVKTETEVLCGNPAEEIIIYADNEKCDLIIMSSHGRSGPSRWAHGSVADRVFRGVRIPVMMIPAPGCGGSL
jgi:nucleotide-binding universal stress UspA family protein